MLIHEQFKYLSKYNSWMNQRLFKFAAMLSDEDRKKDVKAFFRSIHGTFNHILLADRRWMDRFTNVDNSFESYTASGELIKIVSPDQVLYDDFKILNKERVNTDLHIEKWITSIESNKLIDDMCYENSYGKQLEPMWWAVFHFFNHQTHHRGQITTILKQFDIDPGITDFIIFLREYNKGNLSTLED